MAAHVPRREFEVAEPHACSHRTVLDALRQGTGLRAWEFEPVRGEDAVAVIVEAPRPFRIIHSHDGRTGTLRVPAELDDLTACALEGLLRVTRVTNKGPHTLLKADKPPPPWGPEQMADVLAFAGLPSSRAPKKHVPSAENGRRLLEEAELLPPALLRPAPPADRRDAERSRSRRREREKRDDEDRRRERSRREDEDRRRERERREAEDRRREREKRDDEDRRREREKREAEDRRRERAHREDEHRGREREKRGDDERRAREQRERRPGRERSHRPDRKPRADPPRANAPTERSATARAYSAERRRKDEAAVAARRAEEEKDARRREEDAQARRREEQEAEVLECLGSSPIAPPRASSAPNVEVTQFRWPAPLRPSSVIALAENEYLHCSLEEWEELASVLREHPEMAAPQMMGLEERAWVCLRCPPMRNGRRRPILGSQHCSQCTHLEAVRQHFRESPTDTVAAVRDATLHAFELDASAPRSYVALAEQLGFTPFAHRLKAARDWEEGEAGRRRRVLLIKGEPRN